MLLSYAKEALPAFQDVLREQGIEKRTMLHITDGDTRSAISEAEFCLAGDAWEAFTSSVPSGIERILERDTSVLPFLAAALLRHLEQFPSVESGLSRTETQTLSVLREQGPLPALKLFLAVQKMEDPLFMGDLSFFTVLNELVSARFALIQIENDSQPGTKHRRNAVSASSVAKLTEVGSRVLDGKDDHVKLNGIERWLGGVHLTGADAAWRWDSVRKCMVAS